MNGKAKVVFSPGANASTAPLGVTESGTVIGASSGALLVRVKDPVIGVPAMAPAETPAVTTSSPDEPAPIVIVGGLTEKLAPVVAADTVTGEPPVFASVNARVEAGAPQLTAEKSTCDTERDSRVASTMASTTEPLPIPASSEPGTLAPSRAPPSSPGGADSFSVQLKVAPLTKPTTASETRGANLRQSIALRLIRALRARVTHCVAAPHPLFQSKVVRNGVARASSTSRPILTRRSRTVQCATA